MDGLAGADRAKKILTTILSKLKSWKFSTFYKTIMLVWVTAARNPANFIWRSYSIRSTLPVIFVWRFTRRHPFRETSLYYWLMFINTDFGSIVDFSTKFNTADKLNSLLFDPGESFRWQKRLLHFLSTRVLERIFANCYWKVFRKVWFANNEF